MTQNLKYHTLKNFTTHSGVACNTVEISYRLFGKPLHSVPIVLINHALTGNSLVTGSQGWWSDIVGKKKVIDTEKYTIITIDIPGNGHDKKPQNLIANYKDFNTLDIARIYKILLKTLNINELHAMIGASLGGGIAWELNVLAPKITKNLITIASDWKATDWILAHCKVQEQILNNSKKPVHDARMMAMLFYRSADSFKERFNESINENLGIFNVESWLLHHGHKLEQRFDLQAYKMVNHLLRTLDISRDKENFETAVKPITAKILQIGIDSDFFFTAKRNRETHEKLSKITVNSNYKEIKSIHGHDGFLIEHEQLIQILSEYF